MADQWNDNIPAMGNQINADLPDIEENMGHMRSSFERIFETWSQASGGNSSAKFNSATGFSDGTYNYEFPTNGVAAHSVIMLGTSDTIIWMYLNAAPPGWKVLSTGADTVLAVAGGSGDYNVNGGNPDSTASWEIDGISATGGSHNHKWYNHNSGTHQSYDSSGDAYNLQNTTSPAGNHIPLCAGDDIGEDLALYGTTEEVDCWTTNKTHTHTVASDGSYRPSASVGKLFQLDTA